MQKKTHEEQNVNILNKDIEMVNNLARGELLIRCHFSFQDEGGSGGGLVPIKLKEQKEPN
jgi:hypothetical protein